MSGAAVAMPQDPKAAFKSEWEALEITEYQNALQNVEADLLANINSESSNSIYHQNRVCKIFIHSNFIMNLFNAFFVLSRMKMELYEISKIICREFNIYSDILNKLN